MENIYGLSVTDFIDWALKEDAGDGDHTSLATIPENASSKAVIRAKENGVVAGIVLADQIFNRVHPQTVVSVKVSDGDEVKAGQELIHVSGNTRALLKAERLVLNCMQRMSGIATKTRSLAKLIEGTKARLLDTRKTTPNFRLFEKWAVQLGGGGNHRFGLYDMILIKDNHVDAAGSLETAIDRARAYVSKNKSLNIEIETRSLDEVQRVMNHGGIQRIMFDNFYIADMKRAVELVGGRFETEASGGISEENIRAVAETGVDFISVGAVTHSFRSLDISMKIIRDEA